MRDELLRLGQEPPVLDQPGANAGLHAFDERAVLGADLRVERERLRRSRPRRRRRRRSSRGSDTSARCRCGTIGPIEKFGRPGITLTTVPGKSRWNWPRSISPVGSYAPRGSGSRRAVLRHASGARLEEVCVRGHVHDGREAWMRSRAVVALEEVLGGDLPVAGELGLRALQEAQRIEVEPGVGDHLRQAVEEVRERGRLAIGIDEDERAPASRAAAARGRARRCRSRPPCPTAERRQAGRRARRSRRGTGTAASRASPSPRRRSNRDGGTRSGTRGACRRGRGRGRRGRRRRSSPRRTRAPARRPCGRRTATSVGRSARARAGARPDPCTSSRAGS